MAAPDFEQAKEYALHRLAHELPGDLRYHCIEHTRDDVVPAVEMLCDAIGIEGEDHLLLMTAAYFHDTGFIYTVKGHEQKSAEIAREILPDMGYSQDQIDEIEALILATRMPQNPHGLLQEIIADADMDSLGRDDFMRIADNLRMELATQGMPMDDAEWYQFEINFLSNHSYFTEAAHTIRDATKQINIERMQALLEKSLT